MSQAASGGEQTTSAEEPSPFEERHGHSIEQFRGDMRVLFRVIKDERTPIYVPLLMLGLVVYAISPVDIIPDAIPIGGIVDEAVIFLICRAFVYRIVPEEHIDEHVYEVSEEKSSPFGFKKTFIAASAVQIILILIGVGVFFAVFQGF